MLGTAKRNKFNTVLQEEIETIIKMIGTIDSFKEKLKLWKIQQRKGVLLKLFKVALEVHFMRLFIFRILITY
jgi:hypothetical protein